HPDRFSAKRAGLPLAPDSPQPDRPHDAAQRESPPWGIPDSAAPCSRGQLIDLGGEDEVAFGQAVDLVRPGCAPDAPPCQVDTRVVSLFLGYVANPIDQRQAPGDSSTL